MYSFGFRCTVPPNYFLKHGCIIVYSNLLLIGFLVKQEMIQNADDAGSKMVQYFVDHRNHDLFQSGQSTLGHFHEPSLITANSAVLSEKDWEGMLNL